MRPLPYRTGGAPPHGAPRDTLLGVVSVATLILLLAWVITAIEFFFVAALVVAALLFAVALASSNRDKVKRDG